MKAALLFGYFDVVFVFSRKPHRLFPVGRRLTVRRPAGGWKGKQALWLRHAGIIEHIFYLVKENFKAVGRSFFDPVVPPDQ